MGVTTDTETTKTQVACQHDYLRGYQIRVEMNLDNGWGILCGVYLNFLLLLTEQVRLCFWNDKDTSQESE